MPALRDDEGSTGATPSLRRLSTHTTVPRGETFGTNNWFKKVGEPEDFAAGRRLAFSLTRRFVVGCETLLRSPWPLGWFPTF